MVLSVGTNTGALMAQAAASSVNKSMESSMERLATGKRINSASDDAAGVAIASRLTSEIKGTNQAIRNAMDGQALLDTAEGAHIEIENILQRMREISVQSRNDTNNSADRANLQLEMDALTNEIDRIANSTSWAGQKLLTGSGGNNSNGTFALQVGSKTNAEDTITTTVKAMTAAGLGVGAGNASVGVNGATLTAQGAQVLEINGTATKGDVYNFTLNGDAVSFELTADDGTDFTVANIKINNVAVGAAASANKVDLADMTLTSLGNDNHAVAKAAAVIVGAMADTTDGGSQGGMTATAASDATVTFNQTVALTAANYDNAAAASGTDDIAGVMNAAGDKITFTGLKSSTHASADDFAFTINGVDMAFADMKTNFAASEEGFLAAVKETIADHASELKGLTLTAAYSGSNLEISIAKATALTAVSATAGSSSTALDIKTSAAAKTSITAIDAAIITLNNQRASLGSVSNRLDSTVSNLTNISSNLSAGRGRIEDADFAAETTNLAKTQILQQASTAMLAQANASKQGVLSLLQG